MDILECSHSIPSIFPFNTFNTFLFIGALPLKCLKHTHLRLKASSAKAGRPMQRSGGRAYASACSGVVGACGEGAHVEKEHAPYGQGAYLSFVVSKRGSGVVGGRAPHLAVVWCGRRGHAQLVMRLRWEGSASACNGRELVGGAREWSRHALLPAGGRLQRRGRGGRAAPESGPIERGTPPVPTAWTSAQPNRHTA